MGSLHHVAASRPTSFSSASSSAVKVSAYQRGQMGRLYVAAGMAGRTSTAFAATISTSDFRFPMAIPLIE